MSRFLITAGILLIILGVLFPYYSRLGLGQLPGDIYIKKENFSFYFPLTTCVLLNLLISLVLWFLRR